MILLISECRCDNHIYFWRTGQQSCTVLRRIECLPVSELNTYAQQTYPLMELHLQEITAAAKKITLMQEGKEIARVSLYFIRNELHSSPYALMEDLLVQESFRGQGIGTKMIHAAIEEAKKAGCYKLLATSRYGREPVHQLYQKLGFQDYGKEFRLNLKQ